MVQFLCLCVLSHIRGPKCCVWFISVSSHANSLASSTCTAASILTEADFLILGIEWYIFYNADQLFRPLHVSLWVSLKKQSVFDSCCTHISSPHITSTWLCNFTSPSLGNSDACHVESLTPSLSVSLCRFCCSMSTFCRRLGQLLSCSRSETHCRVFDRYQPDPDALKKPWNSVCSIQTNTVGHSFLTT